MFKKHQKVQQGLICLLAVLFSLGGPMQPVLAGQSNNQSEVDQVINLMAEQLVIQSESAAAYKDNKMVDFPGVSAGKDSSSKLFFLDQLAEKIHLAITRNDFKKIKLLSKYNNERLEEIDRLIRANNLSAVNQTLSLLAKNNTKVSQLLSSAENDDQKSAAEFLVGNYFTQQKWLSNNILPLLKDKTKEAAVAGVLNTFIAGNKILVQGLNSLGSADQNIVFANSLVNSELDSSQYVDLLNAAAIENLVEAAELAVSADEALFYENVQDIFLTKFSKKITDEENLSSNLEKWLTYVNCDPASCLAAISELAELKPDNLAGKVNYDNLKAIVATKLAEDLTMVSSRETIDLLVYNFTHSDVDDANNLNELASLLLSLTGNEELAALINEYGDDLSGELIMVLVENPEVTQALLAYEGKLTYEQVEAILKIYGVALTSEQEQALKAIMALSEEVNTEMVKAIVKLTADTLTAEQKASLEAVLVDYLDGGLDETTKDALKAVAKETWKTGLNDVQQQQLVAYVDGLDQIVNVAETMINIMELLGADLDDEQKAALTTLFNKADDGFTAEELDQLLTVIIRDGDLSEEEKAYLRAQLAEVDANTNPANLVPFLTYLGVELNEEQSEALAKMLTDIDETVSSESVAKLMDIAKGGLSAEEIILMQEKIKELDQSTSWAAIVPYLSYFGVELTEEQEKLLTDVLTDMDSAYDPTKTKQLLQSMVVNEQLTEEQKNNLETFLINIDEDVDLEVVVMSILNYCGVEVPPEGQLALNEMLKEIDESNSLAEINYEKVGDAARTYGLTAEEKQEMAATVNEYREDFSLENIQLLVEQAPALSELQSMELEEIVAAANEKAMSAIESGDLNLAEYVGSNPQTIETINKLYNYVGLEEAADLNEAKQVLVTEVEKRVAGTVAEDAFKAIESQMNSLDSTEASSLSNISDDMAKQTTILYQASVAKDVLFNNIKSQIISNEKVIATVNSIADKAEEYPVIYENLPVEMVWEIQEKMTENEMERKENIAGQESSSTGVNNLYVPALIPDSSTLPDNVNQSVPNLTNSPSTANNLNTTKPLPPMPAPTTNINSTINNISSGNTNASLPPLPVKNINTNITPPPVSNANITVPPINVNKTMPTNVNKPAVDSLNTNVSSENINKAVNDLVNSTRGKLK